MRRKLLPVLLGTAVVALAAAAFVPQRSIASSVLSARLGAQHGRLLGVMGDPWHSDEYSRALGTNVQVIENFMPWGEKKLPTHRLQELERRGLTPLISWLPRETTAQANPRKAQPEYANATIAGGRHDAYIRRFARSLASFHGTVFLRYAPEFDGRWEAWHPDPAAYAQAWRHIHDIFREQGARNVKFVWSPALPWKNTAEWFGLVDQYWPGAAYVDYVGVTTVSHDHEGIGVFARRVPLLRRFGKPIVLPEVYAPESIRAGWLAGMVRLVNRMPDVKVVVWTDLDRRTPITRSGSRQLFKKIAHAGS
jgi:hypothetical protein